MLLPPQVIPFLQHEDPAVRSHASDYLAKAHDPSPATADDLWRAIDRFGLQQSIPLLADLRGLPQTEWSYARALQTLLSGVDENTDYHLQLALQSIDFSLLLAHRDELLSAEQLVPHVRAHLRQRLELSGRPLDELWEALIRHSDEVENQNWGKLDNRVSARLIEAAAGHGE